MQWQVHDREKMLKTRALLLSHFLFPTMSFLDMWGISVFCAIAEKLGFMLFISSLYAAENRGLTASHMYSFTSSHTRLIAFLRAPY